MGHLDGQNRAAGKIPEQLTEFPLGAERIYGMIGRSAYVPTAGLDRHSFLPREAVRTILLDTAVDSAIYHLLLLTTCCQQEPFATALVKETELDV